MSGHALEWKAVFRGCGPAVNLGSVPASINHKCPASRQDSEPGCNPKDGTAEVFGHFTPLRCSYRYHIAIKPTVFYVRLQ